MWESPTPEVAARALRSRKRGREPLFGSGFWPIGGSSERYLPADDLFTPMAERLMIKDLQPVWNVILEGFGVNPQGAPRQAEQMRPKWHEVHTGVRWADGMRPQPSGPVPLREAVREHLKLHAAPPTNAAGRPPGAI